MVLQPIRGAFSVCQLRRLPESTPEGEIWFLARTDEEISLVCRPEHVPEDALSREDGWRAFRIEGVLDFSLIGILSKISSVLADEKIGLFAVSTYNTDYILVKQANFDRALNALARAGYAVADDRP